MKMSIRSIFVLAIFSLLTSDYALADSGGSSSLPQPASAASPVLQTTVVKDSQPTSISTPQDNSPQDTSVESFFQIDPTKRNSPQNLLMQSATVASSTNNKNKSLPYDLYRGVWHVLDNVGIPMFFGQDPYIDPSISRTYLIPSPKLPSERAAEKELSNKNNNAASQLPSVPPSTSAQSTSTNTQSINIQSMPQKIPESELEGVTLPAPRDDVHAPAP